MNANIGINEWEEMRQQVSLLKGKLEKEQIVNEKLIHRSMYSKMTKVKKNSIILCSIGLLNIPCSFHIFYRLGFSLSFLVVTALFSLIAVIYTVWAWYGLKADSLFDEDLLEQSRKIVLLKRRYFWWLWFGIPFLCVWLGWFAVELVQAGWSDFTLGFVPGAAVGIVFGLILGIRNYRKTQGQLDEVLKQIDELTR